MYFALAGGDFERPDLISGFRAYRLSPDGISEVYKCRVGTQVIQCEHLDGRRISSCDDPTRREGGVTLIRTDPYQETTNPRTRLGPTTVGLDRMRPLRGAGHSTGIIASAPRGARPAISAN